MPRMPRLRALLATFMTVGLLGLAAPAAHAADIVIAIPPAPEVADDPNVCGDAHYKQPSPEQAAADQVVWTLGGDGGALVEPLSGRIFRDNMTVFSYPKPADVCNYTPPDPVMKSVPDAQDTQVPNWDSSKASCSVSWTDDKDIPTKGYAAVTCVPAAGVTLVAGNSGWQQVGANLVWRGLVDLSVRPTPSPTTTTTSPAPTPAQSTTAVPAPAPRPDPKPVKAPTKATSTKAPSGSTTPVRPARVETDNGPLGGGVDPLSTGAGVLMVVAAAGRAFWRRRSA